MLIIPLFPVNGIKILLNIEEYFTQTINRGDFTVKLACKIDIKPQIDYYDIKVVMLY